MHSGGQYTQDVVYAGSAKAAICCGAGARAVALLRSNTMSHIFLWAPSGLTSCEV
jgi:hypothetical protein